MSSSVRVLTDANFSLYAAKHYDNPYCSSVAEFEEDLATIKYLRRLLKKYEQRGDISVRLFLNHMISFYNVFGGEAGAQMLFFKMDREHWGTLKAFMIYLDRYPYEVLNEIGFADIETDQKALLLLKEQVG